MNQRVTPARAGAFPPDGATYWMMRKMSGSMDAAERAEFAAWLAYSPENAQAFADLEKRLAELEPAGDALLAEEFERQLAQEANRGEEGRRAGLTRVAAALAATAVIIVIAIFARDAGPARPEIFATAIGESSTVALADGSRAELNTASRIEVKFGPSKRLVDLKEGEAFFNVEKDRDRPFVVRTDAADITVTGTSFSVFADGGRSGVHVLTGVVEVAPIAGPSATLLAGDAIEIGDDGRAGVIERYDPGLVLAWRSGKARFREAPLGEVVAALNRYFETPIALEDQSLAALPVTGEFDIRDRDTAVKALALIFKLEAREEPARVILSAPERQ